MTETKYLTLREHDLDVVFGAATAFPDTAEWDDISSEARQIRLICDQAVHGSYATTRPMAYDRSELAMTDVLIARDNPEIKQTCTKLKHLIFIREKHGYVYGSDLQTSLANFPNLRSLDVLGILRPGSTIDLGSLPFSATLENLKASVDSVGGLQAVVKLTTLRRLALDWMMEADLGAISTLTNLEGLHLVGGSNLKGIRQMPNLRSFSIEDPKSITSFRGFDWPRIEGIALCGSGVKSVDGIETFHSLKRLDLIVVRLSDLDPIAKLPHLRNLRLDHVPAVSDFSSLTKLHSLEALSIARRDNSTLLTNFDFLRGMEGLRELDLKGSLEGADLSALLELPGLRRLSVSSSFGKWARQLRDLDPGVELQIFGGDAEQAPSLEVAGIPIREIHGEWVVSLRNVEHPETLEAQLRCKLRAVDPDVFDRLEFDSESSLFCVVAETKQDATEVAKLLATLLDV